MYVFLLIVVVIITGTYLFMHTPQFGKAPSGARLQAIKNSPNYKDGQFSNVSPTPQLTEGANMYSVMKDFFLGDKTRRAPLSPLPSQKTDFQRLDPERNVLVWFGHSSYFLQVDGKKILVDPVFSGNASPVSGSAKSFKGSDVYSPADIPDLDYLIITHDHWDHLDYPTVSQLLPKVKFVITSLGVGAHLERWGYDPGIIAEMDWHTELALGNGFTVNGTPGRHFSGRTFRRNRTIWSSFVLTTPKRRIFIGGDSGYDTHFAEIGSKFGPFDLVILENGQYNKSWKYIHMMPEETVQAAIDLKAKTLLPVHWAKFSLSLHDWDEPIKRVVKEAASRGVALLHPMIGEALEIDAPAAQRRWWEAIQ